MDEGPGLFEGGGEVESHFAIMPSKVDPPDQVERREANMRMIKVNGQDRQVNASDDTPLLSVLRNELGVMTPKFGCGMAMCGACSMLLGDEEIRSCVTPLSALEGKDVTTADGLNIRFSL